MKNILLLLILVACGVDEQEHRPLPTETEESDTQKKIAYLTGVIGSLIESDFKTCPASGDTAEVVIRNICKIAQASTVEVREELKNNLSQFVDNLQNQVDSASVSIDQLNTDVQALEDELATLTATVSGTMESVSIGGETATGGPLWESVLRKADKTRINGYVESYGSTLNLQNNPLTTTNASSTVLITMRNFSFATTDVSTGTERITINSHGFTNGDPVRFSSTTSLPAPLLSTSTYYVIGTAANDFQVSATLNGAAVDLTSSGVGTLRVFLKHAASANDRFQLVGFTSGRGLYLSDVIKDVTITAVVSNATTETLSYTASHLANSSGSLGGSTAFIRKINGRGMSTVWQSGDAEDVAVRTSTVGSQPYNFIIEVESSLAYICYSQTDVGATFSTLDTGASAITGAGFDNSTNVRCK